MREQVSEISRRPAVRWKLTVPLTSDDARSFLHLANATGFLSSGNSFRSAELFRILLVSALYGSSPVKTRVSICVYVNSFLSLSQQLQLLLAGLRYELRHVSGKVSGSRGVAKPVEMQKRQPSGREFCGSIFLILDDTLHRDLADYLQRLSRCARGEDLQAARELLRVALQQPDIEDVVVGYMQAVERISGAIREAVSLHGKGIAEALRTAS